MTLSVALCTYNGESFIREQLESILNQTMAVDEIIVCDDMSTDKTLDIVEQIKTATTVPIYIHRNDKQLGAQRNFQQAVDLCHGNIIFLSDQDDIWMPEKVQTIVNFFDNNKSISTVFTNANLIDSDNNPTGEYIFDYFFDTLSHKLFDKGLGAERFAYSNCATGATIAIHRGRYENIRFSEYCTEGIFHDYVIAIQALTQKALAYIDTPLIKYRIHSDQSVGLSCEKPPIKTWKEPFIGNYTPFLQVAQSDYLNQRIQFLEYRKKIKYTPSGALKAISKLPVYLKYYNSHGLSLLLYDMYASLKHAILRRANNNDTRILD